MSGKETKLDDLNVELSKEEEDIVDSIISELNGDEEPSKQPPQQQQRPPQQRPPQQQQMPQGSQGQQMPQGQPMSQGMMPPNMMQQQQMQQQQMQQQQMQQQQMMQQKMMQQKMMEEQMKEKEKVEELSMTDKIKRDIREPGIVMFLTLIMLLPQTNGILTSTKLSLFLNADGSISIYGLMIKALLAGIFFFLFKKYM
jgi:hypothetical protein